MRKEIKGNRVALLPAADLYCNEESELGVHLCSLACWAFPSSVNDLTMCQRVCFQQLTLLPLPILSVADFLHFLVLLAVVTGSAGCLEAVEGAAVVTAVTADAGGDPSPI